MSAFAQEMAQFDEEFDKERARGGQLGDGKYQAQIVEARVEENNGLYSWVINFQSPDGRIRKWYNLDHEVGRRIAAQDLSKFGYNGKLSELETPCEEGFFIGLMCAITVKTKPGEDRDYVNVYLDRVLGKGDLPDEAAPASQDDDIPF